MERMGDKQHNTGTKDGKIDIGELFREKT